MLACLPWGDQWSATDPADTTKMKSQRDAPVRCTFLVGPMGHPMTAPPMPVYPNLWAEEIPDVRAPRWAEDETFASLRSM